MHASANRYVAPGPRPNNRPKAKPDNCGAYTIGEFVAVLLNGKSTVADDLSSATVSEITTVGSYPSYCSKEYCIQLRSTAPPTTPVAVLCSMLRDVTGRAIISPLSMESMR